MSSSHGDDNANTGTALKHMASPPPPAPPAAPAVLAKVPPQQGLWQPLGMGHQRRPEQADSPVLPPAAMPPENEHMVYGSLLATPPSYIVSLRAGLH